MVPGRHLALGLHRLGQPEGARLLRPRPGQRHHADAGWFLVGAYWYNGQIYGSEIARGFDAFKLVPTTAVAQQEIDAAKTVKLNLFNAQGQPRLSWESSFELVRAYQVQAERAGLGKLQAKAVDALIDEAQRLKDRHQKLLASVALKTAAALLKKSDPAQARLQSALNDLAKTVLRGGR